MLKISGIKQNELKFTIKITIKIIGLYNFIYILDSSK